MAYDTNFKDKIVKKVLSTDRQDTIKNIGKQTNVSVKTIRRWVLQYKNQVPLGVFLSEKIKIKAILATMNNAIEDKAKFCRSNGILLEDLNEWELDLKNCISEGAVSKMEYKKLKSEKQRLEKLLRDKEKELAKKDKAIAEAAALLDVQKKVQILLGNKELN